MILGLMLVKAVGIAFAALAWQGWRLYCRRAHQGLETEQAAEVAAPSKVSGAQHAHAASKCASGEPTIVARPSCCVGQ